MSNASQRRAVGIVRICAFVLILLVFAATAKAACLRNVADDGARLIPAAFGAGGVPPGHVGLTYVGHASFLIETAAGAKIVTDYNDYVRPDVLPDIVTMNNAHSTHYSIDVDPRIRYVLQGWGTTEGPRLHDLTYEDVHVRNVPTNVRDGDTTRQNGNSIFVFETAGLCIAHLGHLHHQLTPEHLVALGEIDVLLVPVDGSYTLNLDSMSNVIEQIHAPLVIPMHFFSTYGLERFLARLREHGTSLNYAVEFNAVPHVLLSRAELPSRPQILVLPGH